MYFTTEDRAKAKQLIEETIKQVETQSDRAYATGLIDMAVEIGIITNQEQMRYRVILYKEEL